MGNDLISAIFRITGIRILPPIGGDWHSGTRGIDYGFQSAYRRRVGNDGRGLWGAGPATRSPAVDGDFIIEVRVAAGAAAIAPPASSRPTESASVKAAARLGKARLKTGLLTARQVGGGFTVTQQTAISDSTLARCPSLKDQPGTSDTDASSVFSDGTTFVVEALTENSARNLDTAIDQLADVPTSCGTFTGQIAGTETTFVTRPLSLPALGDHRAGLRLTAELSGIPLVVEDFAEVRHGQVLLLLSYAAVQDADNQTFQALLAKAEAKAAGLR